MKKTVFSKPVTQQAEALTDILTSAFQKFVPTKTIVIRVSDQPWVNSYTRLLVHKKNINYQFLKRLTILTLMLYLNMVLHHKLSPGFLKNGK